MGLLWLSSDRYINDFYWFNKNVYERSKRGNSQYPHDIDIIDLYIENYDMKGENNFE